MKTTTYRKVHLYGLLIFAFAPPVINSLVIFAGAWHPGPASKTRLTIKIAYELAVLAALAWILGKQGRQFKSIGLFPPRLADIGHSILLFLGALVGNGCVFVFINLFLILTKHWFHRTWDISAALFGSTITVLPFLLVLVNPFCEELLVRAFLITEVEELYGSTKIASFVSVALQASYHLYQGLRNALALSACFTIFTMYYARKRRILPVILAHLYMDVLALLLYVHLLHHAHR